MSFSIYGWLNKTYSSVFHKGLFSHVQNQKISRNLGTRRNKLHNFAVVAGYDARGGWSDSMPSVCGAICACKGEEESQRGYDE